MPQRSPRKPLPVPAGQHPSPVRRRMLTLALALATSGVTSLAQAAARLQRVRLVQQRTMRLHLDVLGSPGTARVFALADPHRLVIDLPGTVVDAAQLRLPPAVGVIAGFRHAPQPDGSLRLVVDLRRAIDFRLRELPRGDGHRLIVDLGVRARPELAEGAWREHRPAVLRDVVVAIDAGHGGKDPGALGGLGTREKDVVLAVASRLFGYLAAHDGVTPLMTRDSDVYVELAERVKIAESRGADVFVSIHADAFHNPDAAGSSVYALSQSGASSESASWLAESENRQAARFGEAMLENDDLRSTLEHLMRSNTLEASRDLGAEVLTGLGEVGKLHKSSVEEAGFAVLKSPIPSILVETAFLSNDEEERKLRDPVFVDRLARAIGAGIMRYALRRAPQDTLLHRTRYGG